MKRLVLSTILVATFAACGKNDEPAQPPPPAVATTPAAEPQPAPAAAPQASAEAAKPGSGSYVVAKGDSLYRIAKQHGLDHHELAKWNVIKDPRRLRVGQELRLTAPSH